MYHLFGRLVIILAVLSPITTWGGVEQFKSVTALQIIQAQLIFDNSTIESAAMTHMKNNLDSYGVTLNLKTPAANKLEEISENNIGKQINIILNGKLLSAAIIQSKLGRNFLITGLTKVEAEQLIESLDLTK